MCWKPRQFGPRLLALALTLCVALTACSSGKPSSSASSAVPSRSGTPGVGDPALQTAIDAYVYGYPLVAMARTRSQLLCLGPPNTLVNAPALATPSARTVVSPNVDTLYSISWLDLRSQPVLLTVPRVPNRYYVFQFLDMFTNTFANVGTRTTGAGAGTYALVAPGWQGGLPADVQRIEAPTPDVWMIGRTLAESPADVANVAAVQRGYALTVLSSYVRLLQPAPSGSGPKPLPATVTPSGAVPPDPAYAAGPPLSGCGGLGSPQKLASAGAGFFDEMGAALAADPPPASDRPQLARFASLGIGPGRRPSLGGDPAAVARLARAASLGEEEIAGAARQGPAPHLGWSVHLDIGTYGSSYLLRAATAQSGLGANVPAESVYYFGTSDAAGAPLTGAATYTLRFPPNGTPPVDPSGFWSLTLYDEQHFLVANPINRYAVGDRTPGLRRDPDGGLTITISHRQPSTGPSNWLPAPSGGFSLILRGYVPRPEILDQRWLPPGLDRRR